MNVTSHSSPTFCLYHSWPTSLWWIHNWAQLCSMGSLFLWTPHDDLSLWPPLHIWPSPENGSLSHRVARVLCHKQFYQFHPLRCPITSSQSQSFWCGCAAQLSLVIALWMELLNYTCSHVKVYFTALPWLKYHWLTLHRHHFIVKGRVKLFTAYKQNYEHQGAFVKVRKGR